MENLLAKDLRIGNLVKYKHLSESSSISAIDISQISDNNSNVEPIPITEEWCIKFGFQKDLENTIYKNINKHCFLCYDNNIVLLLEEENNWCITKIKYVHELQNLYFALTFDELKLIEK